MKTRLGGVVVCCRKTNLRDVPPQRLVDVEEAQLDPAAERPLERVDRTPLAVDVDNSVFTELRQERLHDGQNADERLLALVLREKKKIG